MDYGEYLVSRMRRVDEVVLPIEAYSGEGIKPITPRERLTGIRQRLIAAARSHGDNAALAIMGQPRV